MRISERFQGSGLSHVCSELIVIAEDAGEKSQWIGRPIYLLRIFVALIICGIVFLSIFFLIQLQPSDNIFKYNEFIQVLEAGINDVILIGAAIFFLITVEARIKRNRALKLINELRSFSHVIDMHQLTKDPEGFKDTHIQTASSPKRKMNPFELNRYLDYCTELLSLIGKIAAVYSQNFRDPSVIASVKDVEDLTTGLSRKIWQKIIILQSMDV